ncbi:MAG: transcriptional regulator [Deltaproteobacteria bacterium]|nr:transcriptional regulator [Deltaproteobacteria bacterium]
MKTADLNILVQEGEGTTLEFKESLSPSLTRELVAFANTVGGKVLLGVRDDGSIVGMKDSNGLRARVHDLARNCDPPLQVTVEPVGKVIVIRLREREAKPVQCSEGFFWRQGAVTQKLARDEIRDFFRVQGSVRFDLSPCTRFRYPADFDRQKYNTWLKMSGISGRPRTEDVLVNIEAAERSAGKLLFRNAGVLMFAKNVRRFFSQAYITCLLARGSDKVDILDRKDFDGGIVADIEDALRFVERNTRVAYRIERLRREEIPEYPMAALREAVTNAVMHRDWFNEGANVFVEIYSDRIEVSNPGGLPNGMLASDLGHRSVRRNPLLADLLHRIEFIEKAGTGIKRMRDEAKKHGSPDPQFKTTGFFTVTFFPKSVGQYPKAHVEAHVEAHVPLTRLEAKMLAACAGEPQRPPELLRRLGYSTRTGNFKKALAHLIALGFVEMTSPNKPRSINQRYRITTKGIALLKKSPRRRMGRPSE